MVSDFGLLKWLRNRKSTEIKQEQAIGLRIINLIQFCGKMTWNFSDHVLNRIHWLFSIFDQYINMLQPSRTMFMFKTSSRFTSRLSLKHHPTQENQTIQKMKKK